MRIACFRAIFRLVAVAAGLAWLSSTAVHAQQANPQGTGISPQAMAQISSLLADKAARGTTQRKINSQLIFAQRMAARLNVVPGVERLLTGLPAAVDGGHVVDVRANVDDSLLSALRTMGVDVLEQSSEHATIRLRVALSQLDRLASMPQVISIRPMPVATTSMLTQQVALSTGSVTSQGDLTHEAALARSTFGIAGAGVKIGVLSDGVQNLAASQASGDLPAVTVLTGQAGSGDEGTAMLEIIHDLAPGAQLYFATGITSPTTFANNIRALRAAGCDIIVDDIGWSGESPFQDGQHSSVLSTTNGGVIAQAVKDVAADGALYFSSAGNAGRLDAGTSGTWEGDFADGGDFGSWRIHNFGSQTYTVQTVTGTNLGVELFWADPFAGAVNDYDLFVLDSTGTSVIASSTDVQSGNDDPYEWVGPVPSGSRIVIAKWSGSARFLHLRTNRGRLSIATSGEISGHAATSEPNSFAVAAARATAPGPSPGPFTSASTVETFSSDGPRRIFFTNTGAALTPGNLSSSGGVQLAKPDFTAADGVAVTGAGGFSNPFFGTSAAAPHAAAIAALIKSANLSLTPAQLRAVLINTAVDVHAPGFDRNSGAGILMARAGVQSVYSNFAPAALLSPSAGTTVQSPSLRFAWTEGSGVTQYELWVGTSPGTYNIFATRGSATSATAGGVPTNGSPIYVRLWSFISSINQYRYADYQFATSSPGGLAQLTSPAQGSTLSSPSARFAWTAGAGISDVAMYVGTSAGAYDLYAASLGTSLSTTVTDLPTNGQRVYVRLWSFVASLGQYRYIDYEYATASVDNRLAQLTTPAHGLTLRSPSARFAWTEGVGVSEYALYVGTSPGAYDIYSASVGTSRFATVTNLPANGRPVFVRLWSFVTNLGQFRYVDYQYDTFAVEGSLAQLTVPAQGVTLAAPSAVFAWSPGTGVSECALYIGSRPGGYDVYAGSAGASHSVTITTLPTDGRTLYVRLWSFVTSLGQYRYVDYEFETTHIEGARAQLTAPAQGVTLNGPSALFAWTAGTGVSEYALYVGTTPGAYNIYAGSLGTAQSVTVTNLPTNGQPVYARLWSFVASLGQYRYLDYEFATASIDAARAQLTTPAQGATLNPSVLFTWTTGSGVSEYALYVGTTPGAYDLYAASLGTSRSATVTNLPGAGRRVFVRLWSFVTSLSQYRYIDYEFIATQVDSRFAQLTAPAQGSALTTTSATFEWTAGTGISEYAIYVGTSLGAYDIYAANTGLARSVNVSTLPGNGQPIYVRLWSYVSSLGQFRYVDYRFN